MRQPRFDGTFVRYSSIYRPLRRASDGADRPLARDSGYLSTVARLRISKRINHVSTSRLPAKSPKFPKLQTALPSDTRPISETLYRLTCGIDPTGSRSFGALSDKVNTSRERPTLKIPQSVGVFGSRERVRPFVRKLRPSVGSIAIASVASTLVAFDLASREEHSITRPVNT